MYISKKEYQILSDLWFAMNESGIYRKMGLQPYKNFDELYSLAGKVLDDLHEKRRKFNEKTAKYCAEQRKFNKDYGRGKGVKAVKIERASDAPLESEV